MKLHPYLFFNGHAKAAFRFYGQCLRGRITMLMRFSGAPGGGS